MADFELRDFQERLRLQGFTIRHGTEITNNNRKAKNPSHFFAYRSTAQGEIAIFATRDGFQIEKPNGEERTYRKVSTDKAMDTIDRIIRAIEREYGK